jgi:hypothetical protein
MTRGRVYAVRVVGEATLTVGDEVMIAASALGMRQAERAVELLAHEMLLARRLLSQIAGFTHLPDDMAVLSDRRWTVLVEAAKGKGRRI